MMDYKHSLEFIYFLTSVALDMWPKTLPEKWTDTIQNILDKYPKASLKKKSKLDNDDDDDMKPLFLAERAKHDDKIVSEILETYYSKRPSAEWTRKNTLYIQSLSFFEKFIIKEWTFFTYRYINGTTKWDKNIILLNSSPTFNQLKYYIKHSKKSNAINDVNIYTKVKGFNNEQFEKVRGILNGVYETTNDKSILKILDDITNIVKLSDEFNKMETLEYIWVHGKREKEKILLAKKMVYMYKEIQKALKVFNNTIKSNLKKIIQKITKNAPPLENDIYVYRGINSNNISRDKKQRSFSIDFQIAVGFTRESSKTPILIRVLVPKGTRILFIPTLSAFDHEMEVILNTSCINISPLKKCYRLTLGKGGVCKKDSKFDNNESFLFCTANYKNSLCV